MQDYSPEDYEEVMSIAEDSGVAGQIVDFRAAVEDSSTVAKTRPFRAAAACAAQVGAARRERRACERDPDEP